MAPLLSATMQFFLIFFLKKRVVHTINLISTFLLVI